MNTATRRNRNLWPQSQRQAAEKQPLPLALRLRLRQVAARPGQMILTVSVAAQRMWLWERRPTHSARPDPFVRGRSFRISTSRFGIGQKINSLQTPLGLHRVARKIGGGHPIGTVFQHRQARGYLWKGITQAAICHRILWLEGLEPGWNQGGEVDTFQRFIYIHGFSDETTLGRPQSRGCIHVSATDLLPLFDRLPLGTLVYIAAR